MRLAPAVAAASLAAAMAGCGGTSANFSYDRESVWRVAVGEAVVWRPDLIDDQKYIIESTKKHPEGVEYHYELKVTQNRNVFARRPSTTVYVWMGQTAPTQTRFNRLEKEFLLRLKATLQELSPAPSR